MVSTFTPNIQLEEPARGDDVGTWDTPINNNSTLLDLVAGAINTISLNNSNVILSAAQFRSKQITFNSTLTGSVTITFPTSFTKSYEIQNLCTGSSAFVVQLLTSAAGGQIISCPPGEIIDVVNDGVNLKYKNLGRIGEYWDYAGSSVPNWVANCTVPPYLNCDGSAFSSATYPALATILGSTTLPDTRNRVRAPLAQGATRLTSAGGGVDGTKIGAGGAETDTLTLTQLPTGIQSPVTVTTGIPVAGANGGTIQNFNLNASGGSGGSFPFIIFGSGTWGPITSMSGTATSNNTGGGAHPNVQPTIVAGITMIRAG